MQLALHTLAKIIAEDRLRQSTWEKILSHARNGGPKPFIVTDWIVHKCSKEDTNGEQG